MDQVTRLGLAFAALGLTLPLAVPLAQEATLAGRVVHKVSKGGIPGAEVRLVPRNAQLTTDSAGYFRFDRVTPGTVSLLVRRLGFAPESATFIVQTADNLDLLIELEQSVQSLDTVTVKESEVPLARRKLELAGFYERKKIGAGRFFDPELLEKEQDRRLGDIITSRATGTRLIRSFIGTTGWIATNRRPGMGLQQRATASGTDTMRGADPRACYADVYLDGAVAYSFGSLAELFDINGIPVSNIAAVEVYVGVSQIPLQYNKTGSVCGVVLIWTK